MCLIIASEQGVIPKKQHFKTGFESNPHSAGYSYVQNGKLYIVKPFWTFKAFWKSFTSHISMGTPYIVHFRIATHGKVDDVNCHPHIVNPHLVFAHNGIIKGMDDPAKAKSDTVVFNETVLKKLPFAFESNAACMRLLEMSIPGNKLAFLRSDGRVFYCGHFIKEGAVSYSNDSYEPWIKETTWRYWPQTVSYRGSPKSLYEVCYCCDGAILDANNFSWDGQPICAKCYRELTEDEYEDYARVTA